MSQLIHFKEFFDPEQLNIILNKGSIDWCIRIDTLIKLLVTECIYCKSTNCCMKYCICDKYYSICNCCNICSCKKNYGCKCSAANKRNKKFCYCNAVEHKSNKGNPKIGNPVCKKYVNDAKISKIFQIFEICLLYSPKNFSYIYNAMIKKFPYLNISINILLPEKNNVSLLVTMNNHMYMAKKKSYNDSHNHCGDYYSIYMEGYPIDYFINNIVNAVEIIMAIGLNLYNKNYGKSNIEIIFGCEYHFHHDIYAVLFKMSEIIWFYESESNIVKGNIDSAKRHFMSTEHVKYTEMIKLSTQK